jgi:hypothetical protein
MTKRILGLALAMLMILNSSFVVFGDSDSDGGGPKGGRSIIICQEHNPE